MAISCHILRGTWHPASSTAGQLTTRCRGIILALRMEEPGRGEESMAKGGFKVFDSDMHIMEPPDLWLRYIADEFKEIAPRGITSGNVRDLRIFFPGDPPAPRPFGLLERGHNYARNQSLYKDHSERGW